MIDLIHWLQRQEGIVLGNPQMIRTIQWRISRAYNADDLLKVRDTATRPS